ELLLELLDLNLQCLHVGRRLRRCPPGCRKEHHGDSDCAKQRDDSHQRTPMHMPPTPMRRARAQVAPTDVRGATLFRTEDEKGQPRGGAREGRSRRSLILM